MSSMAACGTEAHWHHVLGDPWAARGMEAGDILTGVPRPCSEPRWSLSPWPRHCRHPDMRDVPHLGQRQTALSRHHHARGCCVGLGGAGLSTQPSWWGCPSVLAQGLVQPSVWPFGISWPELNWPPAGQHPGHLWVLPHPCQAVGGDVEVTGCCAVPPFALHP